jgi:hypothetical protein
VSTAESHELVVAEAGSIPAEQIASLGLRPGAHVRVVESERDRPRHRLEGALPDFPEISWEDFEHASALARSDLRDG